MSIIFCAIMLWFLHAFLHNSLDISAFSFYFAYFIVYRLLDGKIALALLTMTVHLTVSREIRDILSPFFFFFLGNLREEEVGTKLWKYTDKTTSLITSGLQRTRRDWGMMEGTINHITVRRKTVVTIVLR